MPGLTLTVRSVRLRDVDNAELAERLAQGKLVEGPEYASERYVKGLKRTLIVSGDTELISAPAYLGRPARAADPVLHLGHRDHPGRARPRPHRVPDAARSRRRHRRADLRARAERLPLPVRVRRPARELVRDGRRQRLLRPRRLRPALRHLPAHDLRALEARARQGRPGGDVPPPARRALDGTLAADAAKRESSRRRSTGCS